MLTRRGFIKALGIGAGAVVVPELIVEPHRKVWQVGRNAPVGSISLPRLGRGDIRPFDRDETLDPARIYARLDSIHYLRQTMTIKVDVDEIIEKDRARIVRAMHESLGREFAIKLDSMILPAGLDTRRG